jgi:hypothetical protein
MKKILVFLSLILLVIGFASAQSPAAKPAAEKPAAEKAEKKEKEGKVLYVMVKTVTLKSSAGAFGENVKGGTLNYGAKVTQVSVDGTFTEVKSADNPSLTGWVSTSSLTSKQIVAGGAASTTTAKEVALAGKGFSQEAENTLKNQKKDLNYADVDRVEAITVREKDVVSFLKEGDLKMGKK